MIITKLTYDSKLQEFIKDASKSVCNNLNGDNSLKEFKKRPFYPLLKDCFYDVVLSYLKDYSLDLTFENLSVNTSQILFNNGIKNREELYVRYTIEYCVDRIYNRTVGRNETKDLNSLLKSVEDSSFRCFYNRAVYIRSLRLLDAFKSMQFDCSSCDDGVVVYGYIDNQAGLSFKGLCCAHIDVDGQMKFSDVNKSVTTTIRAESISDGLWLDLLETNADLFDFDDLIEMTTIYETNESGLVLFRQLEYLDSMRHQTFPDDIQVVLVRKGIQPEKVWVRGELVINEKGVFRGTLLNEPFNDFGIHAGDSIPFAFVNSEDMGAVCVYIDVNNMKDDICFEQE